MSRQESPAARRGADVPADGNCQHTLYACFIGYVVQAVVNCFVPLLFVTFQSQYGIPLEQITLLITVNFLIQLVIDLLSAGFIDRIGYRASALLAHAFSAAGLVALTLLPELVPGHFGGILAAVCLYAIGGGLLEVLISPIVEACPTSNKEGAMSLLHSFYCWGATGVVLLSTVFFALFGTASWKALALIWALLPIANGVFFTRVPIYSLHEEGERGMSMGELTRVPVFWLLMLMMVCSGAAEQSVSQWASTFAEQGLGITKTLGDLVGPMSFSILMGLSRLLFGKYGERFDSGRVMRLSCCLCIAAYLTITLAPSPAVRLVGCAVCGFSVGVLWPGTFSRSSAALPRGGTVLFALLALAGDLGCSGGPTLVGFVSSAAGGNLASGILAAIAFPTLLLVALLATRKPSRG